MQRSNRLSNTKLMLSTVVVCAAFLMPSTVGFSSVLPPSAQATSPPVSFAVETTAAGQAPPNANEQALSGGELIERWEPFIEEAARRFAVSAEWIRAVIRMESGGRTLLDGKPITSHAGAMGIMQLMPATYGEMRELHGLGADPHDPRDNVLAGTAYLRWLYEKYGYPKMFAAYNAGPGTLEQQLAGARSLPRETQNYLRGIARMLGDTPEPSQPARMVATLTRPNGTSIAVDAETVTSIRAALPNEYVPGVRSVVAMGNKEQGVIEDLQTVAAELKRGSPAR
jgi:soluble lytic murein transglycosylase-like protein